MVSYLLLAAGSIPQEVDPLEIHEGRVMWSPVFEIICGLDGSFKFFLHGRGREGSCLYPGFVAMYFYSRRRVCCWERKRSKDDESVLLERRSRTMLLKMYKFGGNWKHMNLENDELSNINEKNLGYSFSRYFRNSIKHIRVSKAFLVLVIP
ncbi:putative F-box protein [Cardamine amara subsp. amara]|uniref:F-box protein n=1 Tax=Cardamine amara subsp. amara TaxID=228776 RepID=A0ABD1A3E2_CARAN